jgi:hypothetical protein
MATTMGDRHGLQRRLTRMYTDTKSSYDFVKEPARDTEVPELSSLYRKLRIQKDRLISWGLGWSDAAESPDIDESLSRAGLSDVVGSVMETIKEILAEIEPLYQSSRRQLDLSRSSEKGGDSKIALIVWDRSRFDDLLRDLTSSIDTLYDLSGTRKVAGLPSTKKSSIQEKLAAVEEEIQFASTRMKTPRPIDPTGLITDPLDPKSTLEYSSLAGTFPVGLAGSRQIVYTKRQLSSSNPWRSDGPPPVMPVLLEYATYDPVFAEVGIRPAMGRFEKLFAGLQWGQGASTRPERGLLNLIGYFEDAAQAHFGLLYELPKRFSHDVSGARGIPMPYAATLSDLLTDQLFEPPLEVRFRLACNLAMTVFDLHSKGIVHGNIAASNTVFFDQQSPGAEDHDALSKIDVRQVFLTSFDLFPDSPGRQVGYDGGVDILRYRSPLDPRVTPMTPLKHDSRSLDLYSLAVLLLEIGLWMPIGTLVPPSGLPNDMSDLYKQLAARCGTKFLNAVKACCSAVDEELSSVSRPEVTLQKVYGKVLNALEGCCVIEDGAEEEEELEVIISPYLLSQSLTKDLEADSSTVPNHAQTSGEYERAMDVVSNVMKTRDAHYKKKQSLSQGKHPPTTHSESVALLEKTPHKPSRPSYPIEKTGHGYRPSPTPSEAILTNPSNNRLLEKTSANVDQPYKTKARIYRTYKISQEHLDCWHAVLMPKINHALRGFYRKHPESVEISLENIGDNSQKLKPTILVVCTSVGKVRSILRKSFDYDSTTFGLMVCRGKILRSRNDGPKRSMDPGTAAGSGESVLVGPANKGYQKQPSNGASISAYVEGIPLPPVSFGGVILVDGKPYGLTVHHMLDNEEDDIGSPSSPPTLRSSGKVLQLPEEYFPRPYEEYMSGDLDFDCEISETGSNYSEGSTYSDYEGSDEEEAPVAEPGDIDGVEAGCGAGYYITQPAFDDRNSEMFPSAEDEDEEFLLSCKLGEVYASSGLRRRHEEGIAHEIDWALFEFDEERLPEKNHIEEGHKHCKAPSPYPVKVAPWSKLHDLEVHCMARTTGLQTGRILPGMSIVKIFGRQTPSQSYQVCGRLGLPGDSGAWLIDNEQGRACGHVLAWSSRKKVAYICPMEITLADIAETLGARTVCFPDAAMVQFAEALNEPCIVSSFLHDSSYGESRPDSFLEEKPEPGLLPAPLNVGFEMTANKPKLFSAPVDGSLAGTMDAMIAMRLNPGMISRV